MVEYLRRSPVELPGLALRTESRDGFRVVLEYENEGSGPFLVDLSHRPKWDLQAPDLESLKPWGIEVPEQPGQCRLCGGRDRGSTEHGAGGLLAPRKRSARDAPGPGVHRGLGRVDAPGPHRAGDISHHGKGIFSGPEFAGQGTALLDTGPCAARTLSGRCPGPRAGSSGPSPGVLAGIRPNHGPCPVGCGASVGPQACR